MPDRYLNYYGRGGRPLMTVPINPDDETNSANFFSHLLENAAAMSPEGDPKVAILPPEGAPQEMPGRMARPPAFGGSEPLAMDMPGLASRKGFGGAVAMPGAGPAGGFGDGDGMTSARPASRDEAFNARIDDAFRRLGPKFWPPSQNYIEQTMQNNAMGYAPAYRDAFLRQMNDLAGERQRALPDFIYNTEKLRGAEGSQDQLFGLRVEELRQSIIDSARDRGADPSADLERMERRMGGVTPQQQAALAGVEGISAPGVLTREEMTGYGRTPKGAADALNVATGSAIELGDKPSSSPEVDLERIAANLERMTQLGDRELPDVSLGLLREIINDVGATGTPEEQEARWRPSLMSRMVDLMPWRTPKDNMGALRDWSRQPPTPGGERSALIQAMEARRKQGEEMQRRSTPRLLNTLGQYPF